jgi:hypothetical protein
LAGVIFPEGPTAGTTIPANRPVMISSASRSIRSSSTWHVGTSSMSPTQTPADQTPASAPRPAHKLAQVFELGATRPPFEPDDLVCDLVLEDAGRVIERPEDVGGIGLGRVDDGLLDARVYRRLDRAHEPRS